METESHPTLTAVTAAYDTGTRIVDPAEIADMLGLAPYQVVIALGELVTTGFLEAEPADGGRQIHRVCPLTRQILGHWPDHVPAGA